MRLSDRQSNVIYFNARNLDLSYDDERLLHRIHAIDILPDHANDLIGSIMEYEKTADEHKKRLLRDIIEAIINTYRAELIKIP